MMYFYMIRDMILRKKHDIRRICDLSFSHDIHDIYIIAHDIHDVLDHVMLICDMIRALDPFEMYLVWTMTLPRLAGDSP